MARTDLTLVQIAVLEAVARCGGIGAAGRDLGLSQPSVSNHLSQIETRLRTRLFRREGHSFVPNERLLALLPRMRALLSIAQDLSESLAGHASLATGQLSIGYSTHQFVMDALARFRERHPGVRIEARSMGSYDLLAGLQRGDLEAAFVTLPEPEPGLACLEMRREDIVLMAARGSDLAARKRVEWDEIARLGLIRREGASCTRRVFDAVAARQGITPHTALDLGSWESMRMASALGIGVGVAMHGEVEPDDPKIVAVPIADPVPVVGHYLVARPELRGTAQVSALFDVALDLVRHDAKS